MRWIQGDTITADRVRETNRNLEIVKSYGHQSWDWRYLYFYWWNERHTDEKMLWYGSNRSAGCEHQLQLNRWENGQWVEKGKWHGSGTELNGDYPSKGRGAYKIYFWDHNNTPTFKFYPATTHIMRGDFLAMIDESGPMDLTEEQAKTFINRSHGKIRVDDLDKGRVYTYPVPADNQDEYEGQDREEPIT